MPFVSDCRTTKGKTKIRVPEQRGQKDKTLCKYKEKFNPLTLKRIEEGNSFILCYFHSIYFYLFILYLFQTADLRRKGGGLIETGAYLV